MLHLWLAEISKVNKTKDLVKKMYKKSKRIIKELSLSYKVKS